MVDPFALFLVTPIILFIFIAGFTLSIISLTITLFQKLTFNTIHYIILLLREIINKNKSLLLNPFLYIFLPPTILICICMQWAIDIYEYVTTLFWLPRTIYCAIYKGLTNQE